MANIDLFLLPELCPVGYCEESFHHLDHIAGPPDARDLNDVHEGALGISSDGETLEESEDREYHAMFRKCATTLGVAIAYGDITRAAKLSEEDSGAEHPVVKKIYYKLSTRVVGEESSSSSSEEQLNADPRRQYEYHTDPPPRFHNTSPSRVHANNTESGKSPHHAPDGYVMRDPPPGGEVGNNRRRFHITHYVVGKHGQILTRYNKQRICNYGNCNEASWGFVPGNSGVGQFELAGFRVGMLICADMRCPELCRRTAVFGDDEEFLAFKETKTTDVILHPVAFSRDVSFGSLQSFAVARALENHAWWVGCNYSTFGRSIDPSKFPRTEEEVRQFLLGEDVSTF